jgi:phosphoglycolate phosphatase-like HAD superfamily hydrolase
VTVTVFDIDGVLADVRHRLHFLSQRPKDWNNFFAAAVSDPVLEPGRQAVSEAMAAGSSIVYVTGRPNRCRRDTRTWLLENGFPDADLHMRPNRDRRPARYYKADVIADIAQRSTLVAVVDDDLRVVEHLQARGVPVLHATWMGQPSQQLDLLAQAQEEEGRT